MTHTQRNWINYLVEKYSIEYSVVVELFKENGSNLIGLEDLVKFKVGI